jgi:hypothetical protein
MGISLKNVIISICHGGKWWVLKIGLKNSNLGFRGVKALREGVWILPEVKGRRLRGPWGSSRQ